MGTNTRVNYANGLDFTVDSMYVTGPYSGKAIVRFNRTTGEYMHHFEDEYLNYPVDIKEFRDYIYVCSEDQVRKYNRLNASSLRHTHRLTAFLAPSCCSTSTGIKISESEHLGMSCRVRCFQSNARAVTYQDVKLA